MDGWRALGRSARFFCERRSTVGRVLLITLSLAGCRSPQPPVAARAAVASATRAAIQYVDLAPASGLRPTYAPSERPLTILGSAGGGVGWIDIDGDGRLDLFLAGDPYCALYRNEGNGRFTDVTRHAGITRRARWQGVAVGDWDNDGRADLYVSAYRGGMLLHNEGGGAFRDVTRQAGLASQRWGTGCAFSDVDRDGFLDLYVADYVRFDAQTPQRCRWGAVRIGCDPGVYDPVRGALYHNNRNGTFTDVTVRSGLETANGKAWGVVAFDADNDGWPDLCVANDKMPGDLFHNLGGRGQPGRFENVGIESGVAFDGHGKPHAGMGVDAGDFNGDGRIDLVVTTFFAEPTSLYRQEADGIYTDVSYPAGLAARTLPLLGWGARFADVDNDGWPDLCFTNGHVWDNAAAIDPATTYEQPMQLFRNLGGRAFQEISAEAGAPFRQRIAGRGLASGDLDNDGRIDFLVGTLAGPPLLLRHTGAPAGHWLTVALMGTRSNRMGLGARVTLVAGGRARVAESTTSGSLMSASDPRLHFGLGSVARAERLEIRWPSGRRQSLRDPPVDRILTLREPAVTSPRAPPRAPGTP
jgi:enediyne biosynthesis protein E4